MPILAVESQWSLRHRLPNSGEAFQNVCLLDHSLPGHHRAIPKNQIAQRQPQN
jgi:hypothetical protein